MFWKNIFNQLTQTHSSTGRVVKPKKADIRQEHTMPNVFDRHGAQQLLSPLLAKGGEGEIYPLQQQAHILVKRYSAEVLNKEQAYLEKKIEAMRTVRPLFKDRNMSWPAISVCDENQQWIGYAMPKIEGLTMRVLAHAIAYKKYAPDLNRHDLVKMLIYFLENIRHLHNHGIMIGDYNLSNFMWNPNDSKVGFIDCDSYQIQINDQTFPCLVGSPDLTAPEHHGKAFRNIFRTKESEYFSIAIVLFMCLMLGRHPYDIIGGDDPVQNLQSGKFAYGLGNRGVPKGQWYNIWSHMPYRVKSLFIQTFTDGAKDPKKRVDIEAWLDALQVYERELAKGYHAMEIIPPEPKKSIKR